MAKKTTLPTQALQAVPPLFNFLILQNQSPNKSGLISLTISELSSLVDANLTANIDLVRILSVECFKQLPPLRMITGRFLIVQLREFPGEMDGIDTLDANRVAGPDG